MTRDVRALELFEQVLDLPASSRTEYLTEACGGDETLRRKVESLLAALDDADDLMPTTRVRNRMPRTGQLQPETALLDRYVIRHPLGVGGMGEVYYAHDSRLDREVAVKVLNIANLASPDMLVRFDREIKAVAALSHPNIMTLFDIGSDRGLTFAVMEFVEGSTLRKRIAQGMATSEALRVCVDVAEGLHAAHSRSLMHRDIKPENIMVSPNGRAKILDFGLARPEQPSTEQELTSGDITPGTIPYMSPEQADGIPLTCATDVFSLGTVLFEMMTGTNPFRGQTSLETLRLVTEAKPPVAPSGRSIPDEICSIIHQMLRRVPGQRPAAEEVAEFLRNCVETKTSDQPRMPAEAVSTLTSATSSVSTNRTAKPLQEQQSDSDSRGGQPTIAVLPLQNLTFDSPHQLFGDAISQEVILELSKLRSLCVIARGSSFQFRDNADITEVSRVLGAKYVLTGSIEFFGDQSVVSVELSFAPDRRVVWADQFESAIENLLELRHTISRRLVAEIESRIQMAEAEQAVRLSTENLDAWAAYHRGLWHMYRFNAEDNKIAAHMFQRAIDLDGRFARAFAGLSFTHFQETFLRFSADGKHHRDLARTHAEKSLELDPHDPFVNLTMGRSAWLDDNLDSAALWLDRSLDISPNYAFAHYNRALIDVFLNQGRDGEKRCDRAMTLSPIDPLNYAFLATRAFSHIVRGNYQTAVEWAERAIKEPTAHVHITTVAAIAHELNGNPSRAKELGSLILGSDAQYSSDAFFRAFQFRDEETVLAMQHALGKMGIR